jgi:hypothetical protein
MRESCRRKRAVREHGPLFQATPEELIFGRCRELIAIRAELHGHERVIHLERDIDLNRVCSECNTFAQSVDEFASTDELCPGGLSDAVLHHILLGGRSDLASVVDDGLLDRAAANFLEGGDSHRGQEADDDDDDHDFNKGKALGSCPSLDTFHGTRVFLDLDDMKNHAPGASGDTHRCMGEWGKKDVSDLHRQGWTLLTPGKSPPVNP